jgi:hypothetical protein
MFFFCFVCNIPNSGASEYSTTDISNSGIGKYYVGMKMNKFELSFFIPDSGVSEQTIKTNLFFFYTIAYFFIFM